MNYDEFLGAVAERAEVSTDQAKVLSRAVLQTLAERISGGEVEDLVSHLPTELQEPLQRPRRATAEPFGLEEFTRRVSERAGVDDEQARQATRAVLITLRDAVSGKEFNDTLAQLPKEFAELIGSAARPRVAADRR